MADLSVEIAGVRFKNPVWTSSSEVTENFDKMKRAFDLGAGAVVAKSYTNSREYREATEIAKYCIIGNDRRPVYGRNVPKLFTNYCRTGIGPVEETEDGWFEELEKILKYAKQCDGQVVGSVFGSTDVEEMIRLTQRMEQIGIPMVELDLACPQGEELHDKGGICKTTDLYTDITRRVVESVSIPVFPKLSPQLVDLAVTAQSVKDVGAAGVTCHNRFLGFMVDIDKAEPNIWGWAGVGGPWMLPITLRWVSKIYADNPDFFILGSSGAYDWEDVVRFLMAGASAVEFCSTIMARGFWVIKKAVDGLNEFLDAKGYRGVQDIIGIATRASHSYEEMFTLPGYKEKSTINQGRCIHCGKCYEICWYYGIERRPSAGKAPCTKACPAGVDAARYVQLTGQGKFEEALAVVREKLPFPFICGIACVYPCETKCARGRLDDPIAIMALKRFIAERDTGSWKSKTKAAKPTGKQVAIIGSGPAGLTAGYYLAKQGHSVTVFEASPVAGGTMRVAIPEYRLPTEVLDREIDEIKSAGVEIKTNTKVNSLDSLLRQGYDAIFVATGANRDLTVQAGGENTIIVAVSEAPDIPVQFGLEQADGNRIRADWETLATSKKGVFAGGGVVSGRASIIESVAAGRRAAASIDRYLGGKGDINEVLAPPKSEAKPLDADELPEERRVPQAPVIPLVKRLFSFDIPERGYTEEEAVKEAKRCLRCDANWIYTVNEEKCKGCRNCMVLCPVPGCINMKTVG